MEKNTSRRAVIKGGLAWLGGSLAMPLFGSSTHRFRRVEAMQPKQNDDVVEYMWSGGLTATSIQINVKLKTSGGAILRLTDADGGTQYSNRIRLEGNRNRHIDYIITFSLTNLKPSTRYTYQVLVDETPSEQIGRFHTPELGAFSFKIALGNCAQTASDSGVFTEIKSHDPLMFLHLGDFHYEDIDSDEPEAFGQAYHQVFTSDTQRDLFKNVPIMYIWDDHDFGGDNASQEAAAAQAAQISYRHCVPHYPLHKSSGAIYHSFTIGRVKFIVTDCRSERTPSNAFDNTAKSMLGVEQKEWLKNELLKGKQHPLTVWINTVPWISNKVSDTWAGYSTERREIANFIEVNNIANIAMLAGDAHILAIDDGRHNQYGDNGLSLFPVFHAGPLDSMPQYRGGPYSKLGAQKNGNYGIMEVYDTGRGIDVTWLGYNHDPDSNAPSGRNSYVLRHEFYYPEPPSLPLITPGEHKIYLPMTRND
ncbi:MAG: alkaline phosphatase D family protein [Chloroflexota bacterium]